MRKLLLLISTISITLILIYGFYWLNASKSVSKIVTSSLGVTNIYVHYGKQTVMNFQSDIKLVLMKKRGHFKCGYKGQKLTIEPLNKGTSTDLMVILIDKTVYRLIVIEGLNNGVYYGVVNLKETKI